MLKLEVELVVTLFERSPRGVATTEAGGAPSGARGRVLTAVARRIEERFGELVAIDAADTGEPLILARKDVKASARYFEYCGGAADKARGDSIPVMNGDLAVTEHPPDGVTGGIIPWNLPAPRSRRARGQASRPSPAARKG